MRKTQKTLAQCLEEHNITSNCPNKCWEALVPPTPEALLALEIWEVDMSSLGRWAL